MNFFESLLLLLLSAVLLMQVARKLSLPYPSMLAMAGVVFALIPGAPHFVFDTRIALALFIAPALMDAAFDFPLGIARRFWLPLLVYAVGGVVVTTAAVAFAGWAFAGLPLAAAVVLGAIVAPPDAVAATAILSSMAVPRTTDTVLRGESLFNDAAALLIFGAALAIQSAGGIDTSVTLHLAAAIPGGILLGILAAAVMGRLSRYLADSLGSNLLQFVQTYLVWIIAEHLGFSPVLAIVSCAMAIAARGGMTSARMRVQSYAVWTAVVFVLNVVAFLMMGMQAREIVGGMSGAHIAQAIVFAGIVVVIVIAARFIVCVGYNRVYAFFARRRGRPGPATLQQAILASWCGMRGLVTLATAFALPGSFPGRDMVVLAAFAVVIATLVLQGLTLSPLIRWLGLDSHDGSRELEALRGELASAALSKLDGIDLAEAELLRATFRLEHRAIREPGESLPFQKYRKLALKAVAAQRAMLEELRADNRVNIDEYNLLLEEIDWRELTVLPVEARRIEETS
jgi:CPA1 family monovalent cation:H+ antiporter